MIIENGRQLKQEILYKLGFKTLASFADKFGTDADRLSRTLSGSYHGYRDSVDALIKAGLKVKVKMPKGKKAGRK